MPQTKNILITGGAGYIGSHFVVKSLESGSGFVPVIYDDFSNSDPEVLKRIKKITGKDVACFVGDIRDKKKLKDLFAKFDFDAVIHFAGKKSVNESQKRPLLYYSVNVEGSLTLLDVMEESNTKKLIFSSTATVYGNNNGTACTEDAPLDPINNYGKSKLIIEKILESLPKADPDWRICSLRYFNPVGAHASGLIGEDPEGTPANLMPFISQVAIGKRKVLEIFGNDYLTRDGTGARDYIHVEDLAAAHLSALSYLDKSAGYNVFNIGTGKNTTVLELVEAFCLTNNVRVPYKIGPKREGDTAVCFADPSKANDKLHWFAKHNIKDMCRDVWNWQKQNPTGYR